MARRLSNNGVPEDIGNLAGDSFSSDASSDNSGGSAWMHKIDVTNFKQLCSDRQQQQRARGDDDGDLRAGPLSDCDAADIRVTSTSSSASSYAAVDEIVMLKMDQMMAENGGERTAMFTRDDADGGESEPSSGGDHEHPEASPVSSWDHGGYASSEAAVVHEHSVPSSTATGGDVESGGGAMLGSRAMCRAQTFPMSPDSSSVLCSPTPVVRPTTTTTHHPMMAPLLTAAGGGGMRGAGVKSVLFPRSMSTSEEVDRYHHRQTQQQHEGATFGGARQLEMGPLAPAGGRGHPKPIYSYSCLIALALKNSKTGRLTVAEIYNFMCENFPYFRTAPQGWKNSVRHNLSLNKCFEKIELEAPGGHGRKSCLWMLNPNKLHKMDTEIKKWRDKDPGGVRESLLNPDELEMIEKGLKGMPSADGGLASGSYYLHTIAAEGPSRLLLVRASQLGSSSTYGQQYATTSGVNGRSTNASGPGWRGDTSGGGKFSRLSIKAGGGGVGPAGIRSAMRRDTTPPPPSAVHHRHHPYNSAASTSPLFQADARPNGGGGFAPSSPSSHHRGGILTTMQGATGASPYSPNNGTAAGAIYSPQAQHGHTTQSGGDWTSTNSTPRYDAVYQYSPHALNKLCADEQPQSQRLLLHPSQPAGGLLHPTGHAAALSGGGGYYAGLYHDGGGSQFSPCKLTSGGGGGWAFGGGVGGGHAQPMVHHQPPPMCAYEAANSALNNNSLLQTALSQSPYKFIDPTAAARQPVVTLHNL